MAAPSPPAPTRLVYVYDALCGWCYGFSPVVRALAAEHPEWPVEVVSGGMIRGARRGSLRDVAAYIKGAYRDVERATGVRFGRAFVDGPLEDGSMYMTSEPPAALLACVREREPSRQLDAAHALQEGIYTHGLGPATPELADHLAAALDLDAVAVRGAAADPRYRAAAEADFARAGRYGIRGFPAVIVARGERLALAANGFVPLDALRARVEQALPAIAFPPSPRP